MKTHRGNSVSGAEAPPVGGRSPAGEVFAMLEVRRGFWVAGNRYRNQRTAKRGLAGMGPWELFAGDGALVATGD